MQVWCYGRVEKHVDPTVTLIGSHLLAVHDDPWNESYMVKAFAMDFRD
jgi:hypothetical protein